ncbi:MAG: SAM-dependent chlorinase/fluorinase [Anaerolineales bacterium]
MRHITLLTDFGTTEGEQTVMKGVIWNIVPGNPIADLTHDINPQSILEASLVLERTAHFFPPETVHIVVVDPGVGTERRPIAARFGDQFFVGPDNGVCTPLLERAERENKPVEIVHLDKPEYWLETDCNIFHGRDIFSPSGGYLAKGVSLKTLGTPIKDVIRFHRPAPEIRGDGAACEVLHVDYYGNIIVNIQREDLEGLRPVKIDIGSVTLNGMNDTFGDVPEGELVAVYSPTGFLLIAVRNGNAAQHLGVKRGDPVSIKST